MRLAASVKERDNNFDVLRLAGATLVLVSHSFIVVGAAEPHVGHFPLGALGVEIFFAISGFLVAKSWLSQPRLRAFAVKRGLRILPALVVVLLLSTLVLGPLVTTERPGDYFGAVATPAYVVDGVVGTATGGTVRNVAFDLPGVFESHPDQAVNRSLWTMPIEVRAYLMLAFFGALGLLVGALPALAIGFFGLSLMPASIANIPLAGSALEFMRGNEGETAHLIAMFAVAALAYVHRERIVLRADLAVVALAALVLSLGTFAERPLLLLALPYLVLFLAYRSWSGARALTRHGDVSYGLYLLAFPVQQALVHVWGDGHPTPLTVALVAFPITYLLALCSWHLVERPALRLKKPLAEPGRLRARSRPPRREAKPAPVQS